MKGVDTIDWHGPPPAAVEGAAISMSIAAASVPAKVHSDRIVEFASRFPG